jgi:hypothetical protein
LLQTVYEPVAQNPTDTTLLDAQCGVAELGPGGWQQDSPDTLFLDTTVVATMKSGSPAFSTADGAVDTGLAGLQVYSGSYQSEQAPCAYGRLSIPGSATGVGFVPEGGPATASADHGVITGWAVSPTPYGFIGGGNYASPDGDHIEGSTIVSDCYIQFSSAAGAVVAKLPAWAGEQSTGSFACAHPTN